MEADVCTPSSLASPAPSPRTSVDKKFILTFESLPVLWDKNNVHNTNKYRRNEAQKKLLSILRIKEPKATVFDVKKKINCLRTNYRRELRKIIASQNAGEVYVPTSWTFRQLSFLNKNGEMFQQISESQDFLVNESESDTQKNMTIESPIYMRQTESSSPEIDMPDPIAFPPVKKCENDNSRDETYTENYTFPVIPPPNLNATAIYWMEKLTRLSTTQRIYAEKAINDILLEAELGNLNKNSVKINDGR